MNASKSKFSILLFVAKKKPTSRVTAEFSGFPCCAHVKGAHLFSWALPARVFILLPGVVEDQACSRMQPSSCCSYIASFCYGSALFEPVPLLLTHVASFSRLQEVTCCCDLSLFPMPWTHPSL